MGLGNIRIGSALQKAEDKFGLDYQKPDKVMTHEEMKESFEEYVSRIIKENKLTTMGIDWDWARETIIVSVIKPDETIIAEFKSSKDDYVLYLKNLFELNPEEQYNSSVSAKVKGVKCRVYAMMPPVVKAPLITVSTTKPIPSTIIPDPDIRKIVTDDLLNEIIHSTCLIGGGSGSGKTYFMNALLGNHIRDDERMAIVEEFGELDIPNKISSSIITPPVKPKEEPLLRWVTESSNLMRLDGLVVGEIKSMEAYPFLINASSGTRCIASVHGDTSRKVLARITSLAMLAIDNKEAIQEFIAKSIKYVIVMRKHEIFEIVKLTGSRNGENFSMDWLYQNPKLLKEGERFH